MNAPEFGDAGASAPDRADAPGFYAIEAVAQITQTPRHLIAVYCRHGLISTVQHPEEGGWVFDDEAIHKLRRIEFLRATYGLSLAAVRVISGLLRDVEELRQEVRFLRRH